MVDRIARKIQNAARAVPAPFVRKAPAPTRLGLISIGGCHAACMEAIDQMAKDGIALDYLRVRGFPFGEDVRGFVQQHDVTFVVEQNRDGQLRSPAAARDRRRHREARIGPLLRRLPDERASRRLGREGEAGDGGMTYIAKPKVHHPSLQKNAIGLTRRDYEGAITTLCAGCGHDSITAAIIQSFWDLSIPPHTVAKLSGIGCSSKTPAYFLREAHGFNSVHGRMPAIATGAGAANGGLMMIGVSGDGDSLSIGLGQLSHAIRRNVNMLYMLENNGVYGLTKGQFSASADPGSTSKKGEVNSMEAIDSVLLALTLGATFVARSFSGDKGQLVPMIKAGLSAQGLRVHRHHLAVRDLQRPRGLDQELRLHPRAPGGGGAGGLRAAARRDHLDQDAGSVKSVMLHDGSWVKLHKVAEHYDAVRQRPRLCLHPRAAEGARGADRAALHLARLEGHGGAERDGRRAAV